MFARHLILDFEGRRRQGARPFATFQSRDGAWTWQTNRKGFPFRDGSGDVVAEMQRALRWCRSQSTLGAAIGFWSYDFARHLEPRAFALPAPPDALPLRLPDVRLVFCEQITNEEIPPPHQVPLPANEATAHLSAVDAKYFDNIRRIREYIAAGDIYQANLVRTFSSPLHTAPKVLYDRLCSMHAMPFSAFLEWDDFAVVSNSPERFVQLKKRRLLTQPIKGTIARGRIAEEDETLRQKLALSAKDRAENVMIVDLLRNDLGRVCEWGSVRVPKLWQVQTFPTLHHLVSTVEGTLRANCDAVEALKVLFPCGSITGAPKIRAMQIIDELERARRGISMGAIGFFGFNGDMEWNVAIRTLTCVAGTAYGHTGGGIVWDSNPESEFQEMLLKRRAMQSALDLLANH
jgi:para-aminobenzoate synthetase component 1